MLTLKVSGGLIDIPGPDFQPYFRLAEGLNFIDPEIYISDVKLAILGLRNAGFRPGSRWDRAENNGRF
jgi:hypothetical protein